MATYYEDKGELKADLKADDKQRIPNYIGVPVLVEDGTNLAGIIKLDSTTQQNLFFILGLCKPISGQDTRLATITSFLLHLLTS